MKLCAFQMNYLLSAVWACFKWYIPLFSHKNVPLSLVDYMVQYILYNYICCFFQLLLIVAFCIGLAGGDFKTVLCCVCGTVVQSL